MASTAWECVADDGGGASESSLDVTVPVSSLLEAGPLSGITVRACRKVDPDCDAPVQEVASDVRGLLHLTLPAGFTGYLEVEEPGYYPLLYFFPANMRSGMQLAALTMLPPKVVMALGSAVGAELDEGRGHILLTSVDCMGETAAGLRYASGGADQGATLFYVDASLPAPDLTETTAAGSGGFVNFPAGSTSLMISDAATETELATVSVLVRAGYISMARFEPVPAQGGEP